MFDPKKCSIPTFYCGSNPQLPPRIKGEDSYYIRHGNPQECLSKGFGAGMISERSKMLSQHSLQRIKYIGELYNNKFQYEGINSSKDLIRYTKKNSKENIKILLTSVLTKKNGTLDKRAINSVLLYLYKYGIQSLPSCYNI